MKSVIQQFLVMVVCLIATTCLSAQIDPSQALPRDPNVRIGKLANGMTYYIRKNTMPEKRVELRLVVNTGSIMEDDDQLGLAHFMEHMNFNGTKNFPKNELVSYLQSIGVKFGADLNAYTGFDETVYILPVPTDKPGLVDKGLQILEDWAHEALLDSLEIEKERGVVTEEWRLGRGADERMMKQTLPIQYRGSKYADRLPIGTYESLQKFSPNALRKFYKEWYRPDQQAVVVVGDIDVNEMEQKIKTVFSGIPAVTNPRKRESFPVPDHNDILVTVAKDKETAFPGVEILFKKDVQPDKSVGDYARYVNQTLFNGMLNSRYRELALKANPPFTGAGAYYGSSYARTKDAFQLYAATSDTGLSRGLYALLEEARRVSLYGFTQSEFERQKKQTLSSYERSFNERQKQESGAFVGEYVNNFLIDEPIPGIEWEYDFVKQYLATVKLEDINKLASQWVTKNNVVVTLNAPDRDGIPLPSEAQVKEIMNSVDLAKIEPYKEKILATSLMDGNKLKPGKIISSKTDEDLGTTTLKLSNGMTVILKPTTFKNDEIVIRGFSKGGHSLVSDADYYSGVYASSIVQQSGVSNFNATDLSNMLKGRNTGVSFSISPLLQTVNGSTVPKELETFFQLTNLYFTQPRKDPEAFSSFITKQKQTYANILSNPQAYYSSEVSKLLSQNNPRGGGVPKAEDFDKIKLDRAIQIYKERFANAGDFTFIIVGAFNEQTIRPLIERYLGSLPGIPGKKGNFRDLGIRPPAGKVEKIVLKGEEPQSQVNIIFTKPVPYNSSDDYALRSLGEVMSIKLVEQLREEKGGVYGVGASGTIQKYPYSFSQFAISFPCAPENADPLTDAALGELKKIIANGVTASDLEKVKEQQRRKLEVDVKQNGFWIGNLYNASLYGLDAKQILQREKQIEGLTGKMMQNAAKKYVNPDTFIRTVLKPEKVEEKKAF